MTRTLTTLTVVLACAGLWAAAVAAQDAPPLGPQLPQQPQATDPEAAAPQLDPSPDDSGPPGLAGEEDSEGTDLAEPDQGASAPPGKSASRGEPLDRDAMLEELYAHLAKAQSPSEAAPIAKTIETLWLRSGSDTIGLLMRRALKALSEDKTELALKLLDAVVDLSPDYAEGWSRRAYVYYRENDYDHAVGDLRRALALEPNHYKALEGLGRILRESGQKESAQKVYQQLLRIHPNMPDAKEALDELTVEVEGQRI